jgi:hypothetical protein
VVLSGGRRLEQESVTVSEYQYYEFLAVDRPLDARALAAVRAVSTRARITPTSFVNTYHWGDFKGNPRALVERYYDAFLYTANWGTRQIMLRLPATLLDLETAEQYCATDAASTWPSGDHVILDLTYDTEDGCEWDDEYEDDEDDEDDGGGGRRLASIIPARADLARGDLRLLYLAWLHAVTCGDADEGDTEPPVPPGLADLSGPLQSLAAFLHVDDDLLAVAAQTSPSLTAGSPGDAEWAARISGLSETDKDALLLRVVRGDVHVDTELRRRLAPAPAGPAPDGDRRTVAQLRAAADNHRAERERLAAERRARERAARDRAAALARTRHLDALSRDGEAAWQRVDTLIRSMKAKEYDQAVTLLVDLRDLEQREGHQVEFDRRVQQIRDTYPKRPALLERLDRAGLTAHPAG